MPRRTHKKSRNGCIECKRRHIKCDERRPMCSNCTASERRCEFGSPALLVRASPSTSQGQANASPATRSPTPYPDFQSNGAPEGAPVNMLHVELLYQITLELPDWISPSIQQSGLSLTEIFRIGMGAPYLMNIMLALSALHLSIIKPEKQDFYRHHATHLQTYALNSFNNLSPNIDEGTFIPAFIFAAILGLYLLCDTLVFRENSFEDFLDRFVQYVRLHQGIRTITGEGRWESLQHTVLKPMLQENRHFLQMDADLGSVCASLLGRIEESEKDTARVKVYGQAVQALQAIMIAIDKDHTATGAMRALVAWPVIVPPAYVDLVSSRRGEALVILAHYGALIHRLRDKWVFRDGGQFLVESIHTYLGSAWLEWLEWPRSFIMHNGS